MMWVYEKKKSNQLGRRQQNKDKTPSVCHVGASCCSRSIRPGQAFEGAVPSDLRRELNATERNARAVLVFLVLDPHHAL